MASRKLTIDDVQVGYQPDVAQIVFARREISHVSNVPVASKTSQDANHRVPDPGDWNQLSTEDDRFDHPCRRNAGDQIGGVNYAVDRRFDVLSKLKVPNARAAEGYSKRLLRRS